MRAFHRLKKRGAVLFFVFAVTSTLVLSPALTPKAYAVDIVLPSLAGNNCSIATVGWVLCPTMRSIAQVADRGFGFLDQKFLSLDFDLGAGLPGSTRTSPTKAAWDLMQIVANLLFVVVFLYIIYNYLVGRTGGAYAIKRLAPRLIIIALFVNTSYWISVLLIDASNIIGDAIWAMMKGVFGGLNPPFPLGGSTGLFGDGVMTTSTSSILGGPSAWPLFAIVAATTIGVALISTATIVLVIMRTAVVATLVIASPVLIVFYLLPNLERFSSQAVRLFFQLLTLYPIIALLLGVGQIISVAAGSWVGATGTPQLVAAAVAALPLLATWFLFKNVSSAMDFAGARMSASIASRRGGGSVDKDARVTGRATVGASNLKNTLGVTGSLLRKQSFSRNRRRGSIGDSYVAGGINSLSTASKSPAPDSSLNIPAVSVGSVSGGPNTLPGVANSTAENPGQGDDIFANASVSASASVSGSDVTVSENGGQNGLGSKMVTAVLGAKGREKDDKKSVTAKDIFSSMNRGMGHESKDKQRSFGSGPAPTGNTSATGGGGLSGQPAGPATSFRAPDIAAQSGNIVSGMSAGQAPQQVVAVPTSIDPSALLNRNTAAPTMGNPMAVVTGTQKDAEARANKYLFEAGRDASGTQDAEEILGHKDSGQYEESGVDLHPNKELVKDDNE